MLFSKKEIVEKSDFNPENTGISFTIGYLKVKYIFIKN